MISICVPFRNDFELIYDVVSNFNYGLDMSLFEIIIFNDGSVEPTNAFKPLIFDKAKYPNVTVINNEIQRGVGFGFDRAVERAKGDIIILSGADIFVRKVVWYQQVIDAVNSNPNTIGCAVNVGLTPADYSLDREKRILRYGANLLVTLNVDDLPYYRQPKYPNYQALFQAKWRDGKYSDEPYEIPCALGAFYFTSKSYYQKLRGWDTDTHQRFQGHCLWGALEPYLSLKSWLVGGGVTLYPDIEAGHIYARINADNQGDKRASRPSFHWWNQLFIAHTMVLDAELRNKIISFIHPEKNFNLAQHWIKQNYANVLKVRKANESIFTNDMQWFINKFDIEIKEKAY
jgi:glycosyltransferase involved in cell wall biosynthesis